jgi:hypothetical protein
MIWVDRFLPFLLAPGSTNPHLSGDGWATKSLEPFFFRVRLPTEIYSGSKRVSPERVLFPQALMAILCSLSEPTKKPPSEEPNGRLVRIACSRCPRSGIMRPCKPSRPKLTRQNANAAGFNSAAARQRVAWAGIRSRIIWSIECR